jgi:hypothetical protein
VTQLMQSRQSYAQELMGWKVWGLPVFAAIFAPWQEKITSMTLISDWFQPTLNVAASIVGPLACMVGYMVLNDSSKRVKRVVAIGSSVAFVVLLLMSLMTKYTLQTIVIGSTVGIHIAWIAWASIYLLLFISFAVAMVAAFHLRGRQSSVPAKMPPKSRTRSKGRVRIEQK